MSPLPIAWNPAADHSIFGPAMFDSDGMLKDSTAAAQVNSHALRLGTDRCTVLVGHNMNRQPST